MHAPGVEVRPLRQITGEAEFNEIFFNDVEVPVTNRLGEEGQGWQVAMTTLLHERGTLGFALTAALEIGVNRLLDVARERVNGDAVARERVATEWIELQALRYTNYRSLGTLQRTGIPGPEGSAIKLRWSEQNQRMTKLGRELLGAEGILDDGWWHHQQLRSRGNTIEAGTSEVLRNIVAERVLGLPKEVADGLRVHRRAAELKRQARAWLSERYPLDRDWDAPQDDRWAELAELGWLGVSVAEDEGGVGLGFVEEAILLEELGYALYPGPYLATVGFALAALGPEDRAAVAAGTTKWSAEVTG